MILGELLLESSLRDSDDEDEDQDQDLGTETATEEVMGDDGDVRSEAAAVSAVRPVPLSARACSRSAAHVDERGDPQGGADVRPSAITRGRRARRATRVRGGGGGRISRGGGGGGVRGDAGASTGVDARGVRRSESRRPGHAAVARGGGRCRPPPRVRRRRGTTRGNVASHPRRRGRDDGRVPGDVGGGDAARDAEVAKDASPKGETGGVRARTAPGDEGRRRGTTRRVAASRTRSSGRGIARATRRGAGRAGTEAGARGRRRTGRAARGAWTAFEPRISSWRKRRARGSPRRRRQNCTSTSPGKIDGT